MEDSTTTTTQQQHPTMAEDYEYEGCSELSLQESQHMTIFYKELHKKMNDKNASQSFFFKAKYDNIVYVCSEALNRSLASIKKEGFPQTNAWFKKYQVLLNTE